MFGAKAEGRGQQRLHRVYLKTGWKADYIPEFPLYMRTPSSKEGLWNLLRWQPGASNSRKVMRSTSHVSDVNGDIRFWGGNNSQQRDEKKDRQASQHGSNMYL